MQYLMGFNMNFILLFITKYLLGFILQDFFVVISIYMLNKEPINKKTFIKINMILIPATIIVRSLPISLGIHTLLNVALILFLMYQLCGFDLYSLIRSTLITTLLLLFSEVLFFVCLICIFGGAGADIIMADPISKAIAYIPCNLIFGGTVLLLYHNMLKRKKQTI